MKTSITTPEGYRIEVNIPTRRKSRSGFLLFIIGALFLCYAFILAAA